MVRSAIVMAVLVGSYAFHAAWLLPAGEGELSRSIDHAAYAMVLAYITAAIVAVYFATRSGQSPRLEFSTFRIDVLVGVLRQGLLAASQSTMTIAYALIATTLFSRHGTDWLAGYGLAARLELLMVPVIFGIGSSLIAIVGAYVGAGKRQQAISIAWRGIWVNAVIVGGTGVILAYQPQWWCGTLASNTEVAAHCSQALRVIGPTYGFFALGLGSYFASQALDTLIYPVAGAFLRLLIVSSGLFWASAQTSPSLLLYVVAAAVVAYGVVVVGGLFFGPWNNRKFQIE